MKAFIEINSTNSLVSQTGKMYFSKVLPSKGKSLHILNSLVLPIQQKTNTPTVNYKCRNRSSFFICMYILQGVLLHTCQNFSRIVCILESNSVSKQHLAGCFAAVVLTFNSFYYVIHNYNSSTKLINQEQFKK